MSSEEKRTESRVPLKLTSFIRKTNAAGGHTLMQFSSRDLSQGGVFLSCEDLSILDIGEEVGIIVDDDGQRFYEGAAKVVRSARSFDQDNTWVDSGFGLMFLQGADQLREMLGKKLKGAK